MKNLIEITKLATTLKGEASLFRGGREKLFQKMYSGIISGKFRTDAEAARLLYNKKPNDKTYQKLKMRYRQRILSKILNYEFSRKMGTNYSKGFYQTMCNVFSSHILLMKGYESSSIELMKNSLQMSNKYDLVDLELMALRKLRYRAAFSGEKEFHLYNAKLKNVLKKYEAELLSEELSQKMIMSFKKSVSPKEKLEFSEDAFETLEELKNRFSSHNLNLNYYRIAIRHYHLNKRYRRAIKKCDEAMDYLREHKLLYQKSRMGEFALHKMQNTLLCRDYQKATECLNECLSYFIKGNTNWLIFFEIYFILCIHTKKFKEALVIYHKVVEDTIYKKMDHARKEKWDLYKLYLYFMQPQYFKKEEIKFSKFLNNIPVYSKDKAGYNIAVIYLEILLNINSGRFDYLYTRLDSFRNYFYRYVKKDKNIRSYYFGKLLETLYKYDFEPAKCEEIGHKFIQRLKEEDKKDYLESLEIVPYEALWATVIKRLKKNYKEFMVG